VQGKLTCVFWLAGGTGIRGKRALMGRVAEQGPMQLCEMTNPRQRVSLPAYIAGRFWAG